MDRVVLPHSLGDIYVAVEPKTLQRTSWWHSEARAKAEVLDDEIIVRAKIVPQEILTKETNGSPWT